MNSERKTVIIVGVLFIIATVSSIVGTFGFIDSILSDPDYLISAFENKTQLILGILIDAINSIAVVVIAVMLFPIFRKHNEALAIGYVGSRIIESVILIVGHISLFSLLSLSQEYVQGGTMGTSSLLPLGNLLLMVNDWTWLLGPTIVFSITALILNYMLFQTRLVPRFLSVWGLIGAILMLTAGLFGIFNLSTTLTIAIFLGIPLALQEMVFAVWLIVKGFNSSVIGSGSANIDR